MKKLFTIIAILSVMNCSAETEIRFPIFGKRKHKGVKCGSKDTYKRGRKQVFLHVAGIVTLFVVGGIAMESGK